MERHIRQLQQAVLDALKGDKAVSEPGHPLHEGMPHDPVRDGINLNSAELMALKHANNVNTCMLKVLIYLPSWMVVSAPD